MRHGTDLPPSQEQERAIDRRYARVIAAAMAISAAATVVIAATSVIVAVLTTD